jgi:sensor c-di-GMP phosphodiesterase-like protein
MIDLDAVRDGLDRGEFFLEYLPAVALADGRCVGAEALVRWRRPTGVVPPGVFIPLVENTPLSGILTYRVMDLVHAELGDWLGANPDAYVSINAPPEVLGRGGMYYAAQTSGLMARAGQVMLEITERGIPDWIGVESIAPIRALGVRVALDDVTLLGGANTAVLARCQFDAIKLDKSLVDQIGPADPGPGWLHTVRILAESSELRVIAEGVETAQQVETLRAVGVRVAQGFYFSRPLPAAAFIAFHRARNSHPRPG